METIHSDTRGTKNDTEKKSQQSTTSPPDETNLLTKKSLALSLSPPRAPPYGSLHRRVLLGTKGNNSRKEFAWARHYRVTEHRQERDGATTRIPHHTLRQRLMQQLSSFSSSSSSSSSHYDFPKTRYHPHLSASPEWPDRITRYLGVLLPLGWQNACRDSGSLRFLNDFFVTATAPLVPLAAPSAVSVFWTNSWAYQHIRYGPHPSHGIHLYLPPANQTNPRRIIFFVHGGAWGSGKPWMYRLVANRRFLLEQEWAVAVVGYRTYPDGCIDEQRIDCAAAAYHLRQRFPNTPTTLIGHSSGAHIALLLLVDSCIEKIAGKEESLPWQRRQHGNNERQRSFEDISGALKRVDSFVGLAGPYDISHHFDYEAARGVEEISPMKPVCGYTREKFDMNSPAKRLQTTLAYMEGSKPPNQNDKNNGGGSSGDVLTPLSAATMLNDLIPPILLIHGVEDETVPFTSTGEAARVLKSCGLTRCDEVYLADTAHIDPVMHLMIGGKTLHVVTEWIQNIDAAANDEKSSKNLPWDPPPQHSSQRLVVNSKL